MPNCRKKDWIRNSHCAVSSVLRCLGAAPAAGLWVHSFSWLSVCDLLPLEAHQEQKSLFTICPAVIEQFQQFIAEIRAPAGSMSSPGRSEAAEQALLMGNLESRVREEILYDLFLQAGPLTKMMICEDKEGKPKSFGYVCFKHKVSVPYAKAVLDGICLYGRPITVQYWRGSSHSPELDSCTDHFEHHIDLDSPADRHQELSGNSPFPDTPLPVNNHSLHDHPVFQEVNQTAQFKTAQSSPELATSK